MTIRAADFEHMVQAFGLVTRNSGDRLAWFEFEGRIITRTKRSGKKGTDLPFQHSIRQQLKLNEDQFRQAAACSFGRTDYIEALRARGLL